MVIFIAMFVYQRVVKSDLPWSFWEKWGMFKWLFIFLIFSFLAGGAVIRNQELQMVQKTKLWQLNVLCWNVHHCVRCSFPCLFAKLFQGFPSQVWLPEATLASGYWSHGHYVTWVPGFKMLTTTQYLSQTESNKTGIVCQTWYPSCIQTWLAGKPPI